MNIGFKQLHIKKPMHRVVILQLVDAAIVLCSLLLVHLAVFIDTGTKPVFTALLLEILAAAAIYCLCSSFFHVNRIIWRYAQSTEYLYLLAVSLFSGMLSCGVITTPAHTPLSSRLDRIYSDLEELIRSCDPEAISIEELFFSKNITTGIPVAHARGVILLCAFRCGVPVYEYTPMQVKQAVVGYGKAEKRQVMDMVRRILHLTAVPRPDDAADAIAVALCHARSSTSLLTREGDTNLCSTI